MNIFNVMHLMLLNVTQCFTCRIRPNEHQAKIDSLKGDFKKSLVMVAVLEMLEMHSYSTVHLPLRTSQSAFQSKKYYLVLLNCRTCSCQFV